MRGAALGRKHTPEQLKALLGVGSIQWVDLEDYSAAATVKVQQPFVVADGSPTADVAVTLELPGQPKRGTDRAQWPANMDGDRVLVLYRSRGAARGSLKVQLTDAEGAALLASPFTVAVGTAMEFVWVSARRGRWQKVG